MSFFYGGQAVIEGVMMRGQRNMTIAVRRPDGELAVATKPLGGVYTGLLRRIPLVRGVIVLIESMSLGIRALLYSVKIAVGEEEEIPSGVFAGVIAFSLIFAVGLFFIVPLFLTRGLDPHISSSLVSNVVEGSIRLAVFVIYLKVVGLMPDIKRVFAYHGAEHKVINAYEDGASMEVEAVRGYRTAHPRCGTGFLLVVLILAILVFALLGRPPLWLRLVSRVALLPVIAAVGYEAIRFGAAHLKNRLVRAFVAPGLALQSMTTREPDDRQLEVALTALRGVMEADNLESAPTQQEAVPG